MHRSLGVLRGVGAREMQVLTWKTWDCAHGVEE